MKTLLTLLTLLGLGYAPASFADHNKDHKCDCSQECSKNCKEGNEKAKDCKCTHCDCKEGKNAKEGCKKCQPEAEKVK